MTHNYNNKNYTSTELPSNNFTVGLIFSMGDTTQVLYRIQSINIPSNYAICRQLKHLTQYQSQENGFPDIVHLTSQQLSFVHPIEAKNDYKLGSRFTMANNQLFYEISFIDYQMNICQCQQILPKNNSINHYNSSQKIICTDFPSLVYLTIEQLQFVHPLLSSTTINKNNKLNVELMERTQSYVLSEDVDQDMQALQSVLPYFADFIQRKEKSVISNLDMSHNPLSYLQAILDKYNVEHPKSMEDLNEYKLRPWIAGTLEKLMPEGNFLGNPKWESRMFRLFDEALVWFEDEGFIKKIFHSKQLTMKPFGVLPLAMITGLKTGDIVSKEDYEISEDDLLRLELEIEGEGVIVLKCADFNQRIKWFECLHTAIFTVARPMFAKKRGIWRIAEKTVKNEHRRLSTRDLGLISRQSKLIRMGTSLVLKLGSDNFSSLRANKDSLQMSVFEDEKDNLTDDDFEEEEIQRLGNDTLVVDHKEVPSQSNVVESTYVQPVNDLKVL